MTKAADGSRWKALFDATSAVAVTVLAVTLTWSTVTDRLGAHAAPSRKANPATVKTVPPVQPMSLEGAAIKGSRSSRVAMIEYTDFQCPYCGAFARNTLPTLERDYIDTGRVLLAVRNFPLENIHSFALKAAEGAECAGRQSRFWEMHDTLFSNQKALDEPSILQRAIDLHLDMTQFTPCLDGGAAEAVQQDERAGQTWGISGTPTFFIGPVLPDGRVRAIEVLTGAQPVEKFRTNLDALLQVVPQPDHAAPGAVVKRAP